MKRFAVTIKGTTPLLHHKMTEEALMGLLGSKVRKQKTAEVKTPREIAEQHAYKNLEGCFCIPLSYVAGAFAHVASDYKQTHSQRKSYKAIAGGVFRPVGEHATLTNPESGKHVKDFEVDIRKATNHKAGAIAVCRPRFDRWSATFEVAINDDLLPPDTAHAMLNDAGMRSGIGSFRVSKGGYFGQFLVTKFEATKD